LLTNSGLLEVFGDGKNTPIRTINGFLDNTGHVALQDAHLQVDDFANQQGSLLDGNGTIEITGTSTDALRLNGQVVPSSSGRVFKRGGGSSIGSFRFIGLTLFQADMQLEMEIDSESTFDTIVIESGSDLSFNGSLLTRFGGGFQGDDGVTIPLITYDGANISGDFATVETPPTTNGIEFNPVQDTSSYDIQLQAITPLTEPHLFVSDTGAGLGAVIDPADNSFVSALEGFGLSSSVHFNTDGTFAYLLSNQEGRIDIFNTSTLQLVETITGLTNPVDVAANGNSSQLWVIEEVSAGIFTISVLEVGTGSVLENITPCVSEPKLVEYDPGLDRFFVLGRGGDGCTYLASDTSGADETFTHGGVPVSTFFMPNGDYLSISQVIEGDGNLGVVSFLNTDTLLVDFETELPMGVLSGMLDTVSPTEVAVAGDGESVYIVEAAEGASTKRLNILDEIIFTGAGNLLGVAFDAGGSLFATNSTDIYFDDGTNQGTIQLPPGKVTFAPGYAGINKDRRFAGELMPGEVQFALADQGDFSEGEGTVTVVVNRVNGTDGTLTAQINVDPSSSATQDVDFTLDTFLVTFADGDDTPQSITVSIIDDTLFEPDGPETIFLNLDAEFLGSPITTQIGIIDNDEDVDPGPNALFLGFDTFVIDEGGTVSVPVTRTGDGVGRVTATLEALAGTAVPDGDYNFRNRNLVFENGEIGTQIVSIPIIDDNFVEGPESFVVTLLSVTGIPTGTPATAEISINDNDTTAVTWATGNTSVQETTNKRDASLVVSAQLSAPATFDINVPYNVGGTATAGSDHNLTAGTLTFPAGSTQASVNFTVFGDNVLEPDETVILTLAGTEAAVGTPNTLTITILNDDFGITDVDTQIVNLPVDNRYTLGEMIQLQAQGTGGAGGPYSYEWEICNAANGCRSFTGEFIAPQFVNVGFYVVVVRATDAQGNVDPTPAQARIAIVEDLPPTVEIGFPEADRLSLVTGSNQLFVAVADDPEGGPVSLEWFVSRDPDTRFPGREFIASFPEEGNFIVVVQATDQTGQVARDSVFVNVSETPVIPVTFEIASPSDGIIVQVGETINAAFNFSSGSSKKAFRFAILPGDGQRLVATSSGGSFRYSEPGLYFMRALAIDGDRRFEDSVRVLVRDPNRSPVVDIIPATDVMIDLNTNPNGSVFFSGLVVDSNGYRNLNFFWDFGNGQTSIQRVPGEVNFTQAGTYQVTMYARTGSGIETAMVTRNVMVFRAMQGRWEPNDNFSQAPSFTSGSFGNLQLTEDSPVDIYKFQVTSTSQTVTLRFDPDGPIYVDIFNEREEFVRRDLLAEGDTLQYTGLEPGFYFCQMTPVEPLGKKRVTLSYSLSIDILNPALYLPEINSNDLEVTEVGLVNLSNGETNVELLGYDGSGSLVDSVEFSLAGSGRINQTVESLFDEGDATNIRWVQVNATNKVEGYTRVGTKDGLERYAVSGSKRLASRLFVPHIAEGVDQWFTRATVVNGGSAETNASILTPTDSRPLALDAAFSADKFDILDRFDNQLEPNIWAQFENSTSEAVLAGTEVFGTVSNEVNIVAGLQLIDNAQDDPAFTYVANTLYFTHIANDVDNFWTGLALVNISDSVQGYRVNGYTATGERLLQRTDTLAPNQKLVQVAETFLAPESPADIAWVEVEADTQIVGFELFGTRNNKTMAGLEASNVLKNELCIPYVDATGQAIHGVSIINPNEAVNEIEFILYSDAGEEIGRAPVMLDPFVKTTRTLRDLFPANFNVDQTGDIPGWVAVTGTLPIAGFQLIFEGNGEQMSGLIAQ
jgi:hypothetical protein